MDRAESFVSVDSEDYEEWATERSIFLSVALGLATLGRVWRLFDVLQHLRNVECNPQEVTVGFVTAGPLPLAAIP